MSSYEKNRVLASISCVLGLTCLAVGGILGVLDGQAWELGLCLLGLLGLGFAKIADN